MSEELPIDTRTEEERAESYRYWAKQGGAAIFAETLRLSIEHYGMPIGDMRDGLSVSTCVMLMARRP